MNGNDDTPFFMISFGGDDDDAPARPKHVPGTPQWQLQQMSDALDQYQRTLSRGFRAFDMACGPQIHGQHARLVMQDAPYLAIFTAMGVAGKIADVFLPGVTQGSDVAFLYAGLVAAKDIGGHVALALDFKHSERPMLDAVETIMQQQPETTLESINFSGLGEMYAQSVVVPGLPFFRRQIFERRHKKALAAQAKNDAPAVE